MDWFILGLLVVIVFLIAARSDWDGGELVIALAFVFAPWMMWHARDTPEEAADKAKVAAERKLAAETPHVIREVDGCKVYEFEAGGRAHYFTRCPVETVTERTYIESCGKNCTRAKSEFITTKNN